MIKLIEGKKLRISGSSDIGSITKIIGDDTNIVILTDTVVFTIDIKYIRQFLVDREKVCITVDNTKLNKNLV